MFGADLLEPLMPGPLPGVALGLAVAAAFLMGFTRSGFGAGGFVVSPLMVLALGPVNGLAVLAPVMLMASVMSFAQHRRDVDRKLLKPLLSGALIGTAVGAVLLMLVLRAGEAATVHRIMEMLIGVLCLVFVMLVALRKKLSGSDESTPPTPLGAGVAAGLVGASQTLSNAGTPIITYYFLRHGLKREHFVADQTVLLFFQNILKLIPFVALGILHVGNVASALLLLPVVVLGGYCGQQLFLRMSEAFFVRGMLVLLTLGFAASVLLLVGRDRIF
jgi:uncharacterized membrane protein YfcA